MLQEYAFIVLVGFMFGFQRALQSEEPPAHLINVEHLRSTMT